MDPTACPRRSTSCVWPTGSSWAAGQRGPHHACGPGGVGLQPHLEAQHAQCGLEEHEGALVEKQVPEAQQQLDVHYAGEGREEPVQRDEGQLCGHNQEHGREKV